MKPEKKERREKCRGAGKKCEICQAALVVAQWLLRPSPEEMSGQRPRRAGPRPMGLIHDDTPWIPHPPIPFRGASQLGTRQRRGSVLELGPREEIVGGLRS
ncbi:hypothetical protein POX_e07201 [Penicillium oxalicum]|uniref:hypothetical protein n=1 Tax=Penicillium oxalicum TaxID=69781 RepID=UPI0020B72C39|nr:hypothetical protein POX_e07201 [Penicillium oxalicum]KAI2789173.1 hypothetical protein POX_e07201 [Penicillium oxalicum]